jgi:Ca-activated chloride channel homolog
MSENSGANDNGLSDISSISGISEMSWGEAYFLWGFIPFFVLLLLAWRWRRSLSVRHAGLGVGQQLLTPGVGRGREIVRQLFLWSGLALLIIALAGPRWGARDEQRSNRGADVLLLIDCSRSMLAKDLHPDRLEAARRKAIDLLTLAPETRMALMPFAAVPVLRCPLTGDHHAVEMMLNDCTPDLFPAEHGYQGTAIGDAIQAGLRVLNKQSERGQSIIIMSDGADDDVKSVEAAASAAKIAGIPVYGLFFGDSEREVTLNIDGKAEIMKADRSTLDKIASETGGICVNARDDNQDITLIRQHLRTHVVQLPWEERRRVVQSERYQLVVIPALILLFCGFIFPTRRRRS